MSRDQEVSPVKDSGDDEERDVGFIWLPQVGKLRGRYLGRAGFTGFALHSCCHRAAVRSGTALVVRAALGVAASAVLGPVRFATAAGAPVPGQWTVLGAAFPMEDPDAATQPIQFRCLYEPGMWGSPEWHTAVRPLLEMTGGYRSFQDSGRSTLAAG